MHWISPITKIELRTGDLNITPNERFSGRGRRVKPQQWADEAEKAVLWASLPKAMPHDVDPFR